MIQDQVLQQIIENIAEVKEIHTRLEERVKEAELKLGITSPPA